MNDVVISKTASIQRCVKRAREERAESEDFENDFTRQDAAVLNVTRACEQAIDLANHVIREQKLGIPRDSGESFELLAGAGYLDRPRTRRSADLYRQHARPIRVTAGRSTVGRFRRP